MKRLSVKKGIECKACLSCVGACSQAYYKTFDQDKAYISIGMKNDVVTPAACIQCGKCAKACPENAITQNAKGVYMVNKKLCKACGKCVEVCPMHVMRLPAGAESAGKCIACGLCVKACPMDMLEIIEK